MAPDPHRPEEPPIFVGTSPAITDALRLIATAAESDITTLLTGENGTGKSLAARRIHYLSPRRNGPFVQTNCASLAETLLDSELFGHEKGAFTGADRTHIGKFELADRGTLFLDEIGELSTQAQAKLLHVIESGTLTRVGGEAEIQANVRLIVATNRDLWQRVKDTRFRRDLFFRISELPIKLPPLRDRRMDIPELVRYFIRQLNDELGKNIQRLSDAAMAQLIKHDWPGNIRELRNIIKSGMARAGHDAVWIEDLPLTLEMNSDAAARHPSGLGTLEEAERHHVEQVLLAVHWKKVEAARVLGITRATLDRKIAKHKLQKPGDI